ncbi:response regulator [Enterococcus devriesei]|uniref:response regulator transcription factor n=1 Tax=Enterococcus devriesei TaxID=319970 RepID=UPI001C118E67|nr:response regulator [Enterococcus devriesei]MBU5365830.1 response regulator [Enterococcus devriesei]
MYKVFIVEDEHLIRESLKRNLLQLTKQLPLELAGEASDGEVALAMILKERPDILLTDIRMPFMNGIELSQEVKEVLPDIQIIFISGFDEFDYAKAAIHLQVAEYLLKPIKFNELEDSLKNVISKLELKNQPTFDDSYSLDVQKNLFLNTLFENQIATAEAIEEARRLNRQIAGKQFIVMLIANHENKNFAYYKRFRDKLADSFQQDAAILFSCLSSRFIKLLLFESSPQDLLKKADQTATDLYSILTTKESKLVIAIGHPVERISDIQKSYVTANNMLEYSNIQTEHPILHYQNFDQQFAEFEQTFKLREKIEHLSKTKISKFTEGLIEQTEKSDSPLLYRLLLINELNQLAQEKNQHTQTKFNLATPANIPAIISDLALSRNYFYQLLTFLKETAINETMVQYRELLEESLNFIQQHYANAELSLSEVAAHVNLSNSHFSTIFSQAFGKTFIECLTEQRLREAKRLLKETDWKLSAIAAEIGYNDPNYFSYIFKRKETIAPKEYRKIHKN